MRVGSILISINSGVCKSFRSGRNPYVRKCLSAVVVEKTPEWYMKFVLE